MCNEVTQTIKDESNLMGTVGMNEDFLQLIPVDETLGDLGVNVNFVNGTPEIGSSWEVCKEVVGVYSNVYVDTEESGVG